MYDDDGHLDPAIARSITWGISLARTVA